MRVPTVLQEVFVFITIKKKEDEYYLEYYSHYSLYHFQLYLFSAFSHKYYYEIA